MKELIKRLKSETPKFFKKLRNIGLGLGAIGTGLPYVPNVPAEILPIASQLIWIGGTIALVAQTAVAKPEDLKQ